MSRPARRKSKPDATNPVAQSAQVPDWTPQMQQRSPAEAAAPDTSQQPSEAAGEFPVVGIGVSGSGLKSLQNLLNSLPADPAAAFVVIAETDLNSDSSGRLIQGPEARLTVIPVAHQMPVLPNAVYVNPPDKYLAISDGRFCLTNPQQPPSARTPVDYFLRSLAESRSQAGIAVILSGSGSDGMLGVKAVKAAGGLVIAEDPTTAESPELPRRAISTGLVDHILPPAEMAGVLVRYACHSYCRGRRTASPADGPAQPGEDTDSGQIAAIMTLLKARTQHDFSSYRTQMLTRRTQRRMCLLQLENYDDYLTYLRRHPRELQALAGDLLISVTDFFRDPQAWAKLQTLAIAPLVQRVPAGETIRVWTPGCATGEEPYSAAMLIRDELLRSGKNCPLTVFASDVDRNALQFARAGQFPRTIQGDVSADRLARYFTLSPDGSRYAVNAALRESVVFADHNLLTDPPFSKLDLVCCRNLLLYLQPEIQQRVIATFHFALRDQGLLFLGGAESAGCPSHGFQMLDNRWRIFERTRQQKPRLPFRELLQPRLDRWSTAPPTRQRKFPSTQIAGWSVQDGDQNGPEEQQSAESEQDLRAEIQQLRLANAGYQEAQEEFLTVNEELHCTNEELDTSKEQLNLLNEELTTVNQQLASRIEELETQRADMQNLLAATDVATICLDAELAIRWFTPAARTVFRLIDSDRGRPLADLNHDFTGKTLPQLARQVLQQRTPLEDEAVCRDGRVFLRRLTQYQTGKSEVDGIVVTLIDITQRKQAENALQSAKQLSDSIIEFASQATLVLDLELRVRSANRSFFENFQLNSTDIVGLPVYELNHGHWDIPELRQSLEIVRQTQQTVRDVEIDHQFGTGRRRIVLLCARQLESQNRLVVTLDDITEPRLQAQRREFMLKLSDTLRTAEGSQTALDQAAVQLAQLLRCDSTAYLEIQVEQDRATILAQHIVDGGDRETEHQLSWYGSAVLAPLLRNEELAIDDVRQHPFSRHPDHAAAFETMEVRAIVGIPRLRDDRSLAIVAAAFREPHHWTAEEVDLIRDVGDRTWSTLETLRAERALRESQERLSQAAAAARFGSYQYDFATDSSRCSPELYALYGLPPGETITLNRFEEMLHPDDRDICRDMLRRNLESGTEDYQQEFRVRRPDGQLRWMSDRGRITYAGEGDKRRALTAVGMVVDVTERRSAEQQLRNLNKSLEDQVQQRVQLLSILQDVAILSNEARTIRQALQGVLKRICSFNNWIIGHSFRFSDDYADRMVSSGEWYVSPAYSSDPRLKEFRRLSAAASFAAGEGLIGKVMASGEPCWIDDITTLADFRRGDPEQLGLAAAVAFPVVVHDQVVAVLECFADHPLPREQRFLDIVSSVGIQLGHVIARRQLEKQVAETAEREQRRIGGDLHDDVGQELTGLRYLVDTHADVLAQHSLPEAEMATRISNGLKNVQRGLRAAVRHLIPVELDQQGLVAALHGLARRVTETHPVRCCFECESPVVLADNLQATHLYRIAQEAVTNAVRHSGGQLIIIKLVARAETLTLQVSDDGTGIAKENQQREGLGLASMKSRADFVGGQIRIEVGKAGGTTVTCAIPRSVT